MLTDKEYDTYLNRVFTGKYIDNINIESSEFYVLFKYPTNEHKLRAEAIYNKSYKEAVKDGMLISTDLEELIRKRNIFGRAEEDKIKDIKGKLEAQNVLLSKTKQVRANIDRIKTVIDKYEQEINNIMYKKTSAMMMSAEMKAEEDKISYLCWCCTYKFEYDELFWRTYDELLNETNIPLRNKILSSFLTFYRGIPMSIIRYIARSNMWRIRYITSMKTSESLFGLSTSAYTQDMLNLVYWSNYYQNIYEMMPEDRPSDIVINDDVELDKYMSKYYEELERKFSKRRAKAKDRSDKLSVFNKEEIIITQAHESYHDIKYDTPKEAQKIKEKVSLNVNKKKRL